MGIACAKVNVLGVGISVLNLPKAADLLCQAAQSRQKGYVCITGVHGVSESQADAVLRSIHNRALLCTPDGMPMVWAGRLNGHTEMGRVYGPDLMLAICERSIASGWSHFFYGGMEGVAQKLAATLSQRYRGLKIAGCYTPPFRSLTPAEELDLEKQIAQAKPDFFWVGLSTPKQERFMAAYSGRFDATLMIGVGAAFDFHTGRMRQAPLWMQRSGLEWLFRLGCEPGRLWKRYLKNNPLFVLRYGAQLLGLRTYSLEDV